MLNSASYNEIIIGSACGKCSQFFREMASACKLFAWSILILFISICVPFIKESIEWTGILSKVMVKDNDKCETINANVEGCENGQHHFSSGLIFYACGGNIDDRRNYWRPALKFGKFVRQKGSLFVLDSKTLQMTKLNISNADDFEFDTHGLGIMGELYYYSRGPK